MMKIYGGNTNPTDVSIDTTNSKGMTAQSHITELHTHEHKELVATDLLNKVSNIPEMCDAVQENTQSKSFL